MPPPLLALEFPLMVLLVTLTVSVRVLDIWNGWVLKMPPPRAAELPLMVLLVVFTVPVPQLEMPPPVLVGAELLLMMELVIFIVMLGLRALQMPLLSPPLLMPPPSPPR